MAEDAITDEVADLNPFKGVRIRANDPRAKKKRRPIRVFSFEQMHAFAKAAGRYEAMVRVFTDTGMRLGKVLPLRREDFDGETWQVRRTAHEGTVLQGTKTDHGEQAGGASDLDLLVDMAEGRSLFDLVALSDELEDSLGIEVDVVTEGGLSPYLRDRILDEAVAL
jgi:predicted nucleotidyltransferase